ncbi:hypothetical protein C8R48DRAFT_286901 [Suillus tomentosus]|nr:hypothetical protein C8R48DRAFT_286901 [Suillus tomentosus]
MFGAPGFQVNNLHSSVEELSTTRSSSSAIVFAVVAALIPSISATPINVGADQCPSSCTSDEQCWECFFGVCNQFHCK